MPVHRAPKKLPWPCAQAQGPKNKLLANPADVCKSFIATFAVNTRKVS